MSDFSSSGLPHMASGSGVPDPLTERYYPPGRYPGIISVNKLDAPALYRAACMTNIRSHQEFARHNAGCLSIRLRD
jgi:hypothetical protein